jgi:hypothetical protein
MITHYLDEMTTFADLPVEAAWPNATRYFCCWHSVAIVLRLSKQYGGRFTVMYLL